MLRDSFIAVHAAAGTLAFVVGVLAIAQPAPRRPALARPYVASLGAMLLFLVLALAVDWSSLGGGLKVVFAALALLAAYTLWRGWSAYHRLIAGSRSPPAVDDVGFTLITLFVGFVAITANDLGAPVWLVVVLGALGVVVGRWGVARAAVREGAPERQASPPR